MNSSSKDIKEYEIRLQKHLEYRPQDENALIELANILYSKKNFKSFIELLETNSNIINLQTDLQIHLSRSYFRSWSKSKLLKGNIMN